MTDRHRMVTVWPSQLKAGDSWTVTERTSWNQLRRQRVQVRTAVINGAYVDVFTNDRRVPRQRFPRGRRLLVARR